MKEDGDETCFIHQKSKLSFEIIPILEIDSIIRMNLITKNK